MKTDCKICGGNRYINKVIHLDGTTTFEFCRCTGINAENIKKLADHILSNGGEMTNVTYESDKKLPLK